MPFDLACQFVDGEQTSIQCRQKKQTILCNQVTLTQSKEEFFYEQLLSTKKAKIWVMAKQLHYSKVG